MNGKVTCTRIPQRLNYSYAQRHPNHQTTQFTNPIITSKSRFLPLDTIAFSILISWSLAHRILAPNNRHDNHSENNSSSISPQQPGRDFTFRESEGSAIVHARSDESTIPEDSVSRGIRRDRTARADLKRICPVDICAC